MNYLGQPRSSERPPITFTPSHGEAIMIDAQLIQLPVDDTIRYKVSVSKVVPLIDVTVTADVELLVANSDKNEDLDAKVRSALQDFIPVDWEILSQNRAGATPGYERIDLKVLAKVPSSDNRNLEERARKAHRVGLELSNISVKRARPQDEVNQIMKDLWFEAVGRVREHLADFNKVSDRVWRIGDITLGVSPNAKTVRYSKGGYREELDDVDDDLMTSALSGAEKVSMVADVTLKSARTG